MSEVIKIKPSKNMHIFYPKCDIETLAQKILKVLAGYAISYSGKEYLKDVGFMTKKGTITKKGKYFAYHAHWPSSFVKVELIKNDLSNSGYCYIGRRNNAEKI